MNYSSTKKFGCASLDRQMKELHTLDILEIKYLRKNTIKDYHEYKVSKIDKKRIKKKVAFFLYEYMYIII